MYPDTGYIAEKGKAGLITARRSSASLMTIWQLARPKASVALMDH